MKTIPTPKPRFRLGRRKALTGMAYAAIPLAGFLLFFAVPFVISIVRSFQSGLTQQVPGLENYISVANSESLRLAAAITFRFIVMGVPSIILFSLLLALALDQKIIGHSFFRTIFLTPYVIPVASTVMVFQIVFEQSGILNSLCFQQLPVNFLHSDNAFYILLLLYVWKNFGYNMILFLTGLSQIPNEYREAARVDGAGPVRIFRSITLPLLGPTFFFVFVISIVNSFKVFREAYALGGAYPHSSIYMLQHFMNNNFQNLNYQRLSTASIYVFLVIALVVLALFLHRHRKGSVQL